MIQVEEGIEGSILRDSGKDLTEWEVQAVEENGGQGFE